MKVRASIPGLVCLLLICVPAAGQPDILSPIPPDVLSAIPADAYGFVATKNLQESYDNLMLFIAAIGAPGPDENPLLAAKEHLGEVNLNGPAAVILLDPQKYPGMPVALLFSAADPRGLLEAHRAEGLADQDDLPAGVVSGADGYLGVKKGFVVFSPGPDQTAAVIVGQAPFKTSAQVKAGYAKGQIVLAGDFQRAAPFMLQGLEMAEAQMKAQMGAGPGMDMPQMAMAQDMVSMYLELARSLVKQMDKLTVTAEIGPKQAVISKWVSFKADSPVAGFMNRQKLQAAPDYKGLVGGPFLMAGAISLGPQAGTELAEAITGRMMNMPSFKGKLSDEMLARMNAEIKEMYVGGVGTAFTLNIGSPMTGLLNIVARYDVADVQKVRALWAKSYGPEGSTTAWVKASGVPMQYVYNKAAETHTDVEIDTIQMQMAPGGEEGPDPMMAAQMQSMTMMFGPEMTFRMAAPNNKQVLLTMGGGRERMEQAINVANGIGKSLDDHTALKQAGTLLPAKRFAEFHLDLSQLMPMMGMMMGGMGKPGPMPMAPAGQEAAPLSLSLSAEENTLRVDLVIPTASIKTLVEAGKAAFGGPPPDFGEDFEFEDDDFEDEGDF